MEKFDWTSCLEYQTVGHSSRKQLVLKPMVMQLTSNITEILVNMSKVAADSPPSFSITLQRKCLENCPKLLQIVNLGQMSRPYSTPQHYFVLWVLYVYLYLAYVQRQAELLKVLAPQYSSKTRQGIIVVTSSFCMPYGTSMTIDGSTTGSSSMPFYSPRNQSNDTGSWMLKPHVDDSLAAISAAQPAIVNIRFLSMEARVAGPTLNGKFTVHTPDKHVTACTAPCLNRDTSLCFLPHGAPLATWYAWYRETWPFLPRPAHLGSDPAPLRRPI